MTHPRHQLDPIIHSPIRFAIVAALTGVDRAEFRFVRDTVEVSDSLLSQHVTTLEGAGYVRVSKRQSGRRATTWLSLTDRGRAAFRHHLDILNSMAAAPTGGGATSSGPEDAQVTAGDAPRPPSTP